LNELKYFSYPTSTYQEFEAKPLQYRATRATSSDAGRSKLLS